MKWKTDKFRMLLVMLMMHMAFMAFSQVHFEKSHLLIGNDSSVVDSMVNINKNGLFWKSNDHFFKIDMTLRHVSLSGTNDRVDIADTSYGGVMYLPFSCAAVYSVFYEEFLGENSEDALNRVAGMKPYVSERDENGEILSLGLISPAQNKAKEALKTESEEAVDLDNLIPILFQSVIGLKTMSDELSAKICELELELNEQTKN